MAHTNSWDETSPTNSLSNTSIDDEIVKLRIDIRERAAVDHNLAASDSGEATIGYHKKVTFEDDLAADPTVSGDVASLYPMKLTSGSNVVPFFRSAVSGICRMLLGDASFKVWLHSATAPVGMKASSGAPSDCILVAVGGATYTTAGATAGTWTISGLTHAHTHGGTTSVYSGALHDEGGGSNTCSYKLHYHNFTSGGASTSNVSAGSAWRMAASVEKLYEPDLTV